MDRSQSGHIVLSSRDQRNGFADSYKLHQCALDPIMSKSHGNTRGILSDPAGNGPAGRTSYSRSAGKVATIPTWYNYGTIAAISIGAVMLIVLRLLWS
jgi:hypothetical protein